MSSNRGALSKGESSDDRKPRSAIASPSEPEWRFVNLQQREQRPESIGRVPEKASITNANDEIDSSIYFQKAAEKPKPESASKQPASNFYPTKLRPVPAFYPVEKSSRLVEDDLPDLAHRLSECLRVLSVLAIYNNDTATAFLYTSENVEMHLSLWKVSGGTKILVELQRRKGDSIAFHRYSKYILDAAVGDFDIDEHVRVHGAGLDFMESRKLQRLLRMDMKATATQNENAVIAIEIAHSLLMKDRMDARQLGLESLCLLTDPRKTGIETALIASHVVLLGSASGLATGDEDMLFDEAPFQEIRETILSLVQFSRIGEDEFGGDDGAKEFDDREFGGEGEHMSLLHNLALAVLANALLVIENPELFETESDGDDDDDVKKPASEPLRSRTDSEEITKRFMEESNEISNVEILSTLIAELSKAEKKPHDAHLSAKCVKSLCRASDQAKRKAKELGAKNVVRSAIEVGVRTHLKLETECKEVFEVLNNQAP